MVVQDQCLGLSLYLMARHIVVVYDRFRNAFLVLQMCFFCYWNVMYYNSKYVLFLSASARTLWVLFVPLKPKNIVEWPVRSSRILLEKTEKYVIRIAFLTQ